MLTSIEELSLNSWPSLQTVVYDGWILRFAHGYTRRANSVNPLYVSTLEVEQKISFCESLYESKNLPVTFKMTGQVHPSDLDERLASHGYQKDSPTSVQVLDLDSATLDEWPEVNLEEELSEEWLDHFCHMSSISGINRDTLRKILTSIIPRHCFVSLRLEGQIAACGLGVLQAEYVGLFDIVTNAAYRRRGYGTQIVKTILAWGRQNSARHAYLQVMLNNAAGLHLYSKLGFTEMYQYWYRIK
jgi:ribosomal protein S18 acetylase RimI-like enzyme